MTSSPLIAVVDDDESVRVAIGSLLRSAGFAVRVYSSAEEFLAGEGWHQLRCLILDQRLPDMDGLELQQHLAARGHDLPIVFLSAHGDVEIRARALSAGAIAFLPKPFDAEILLDALGVSVGKPRRPAS